MAVINAENIGALICVEESDGVSNYPVMLHELQFQPVLQWVVDALELIGIKRFYLASPEPYIPLLEPFFAGKDACFWPAGKPVGDACFPGGGLLVIAAPSLLTTGALELLINSGAETGGNAALSLVGDDGAPARVYYLNGDAARGFLACDDGERGVEELLAIWGGSIQNIAVPKGQGGAARLATPLDLLIARQSLHAAAIDFHAGRGVTFLDPASVQIGPSVLIGADTTILPQVILEGRTVIGRDCEIGPMTTLRHVRMGDRCSVNASQIEESSLDNDVTVGPYAHIRPGCLLAENVKVGSFVQMKNTRVGKNTLIPHLSYLGDAEIGEDVNIGCGAVTANFNGFEKNRTIIGDNAFIGCSTTLVAPVTVGEGAWTAAGSVIDGDIPAGALGIARSRQTVKESWVAAYRKKHQENK